MNVKSYTKALLAGIIALPMIAAPAGTATAQQTVSPSQEIVLSIGRGELITIPGSMSDVFVANESVADVQVKSQRQLPGHIGPHLHTACPPIYRRARCNSEVELVTDRAAAHIGKRGVKQRNCQGNQQSVVKRFCQHLAPGGGYRTRDIRGFLPFVDCLLQVSAYQIVTTFEGFTGDP